MKAPFAVRLLVAHEPVQPVRHAPLARRVSASLRQKLGSDRATAPRQFSGPAGAWPDRRREIALELDRPHAHRKCRQRLLNVNRVKLQCPGPVVQFFNGVYGQADVVEWLRRRIRPVASKDLDRRRFGPFRSQSHDDCRQQKQRHEVSRDADAVTRQGVECCRVPPSDEMFFQEALHVEMPLRKFNTTRYRAPISAYVDREHRSTTRVASSWLAARASPSRNEST